MLPSLRRALVALALLATASSASAQGEGRVVVLGFDGADWRTTERMMEAGDLPNLKALMDEGAAGPLISTNPAESAAGWAAINTGANPARNGVPSFIGREVIGGTPGPGFAHVEQVDKSMEELEPTGLLGLAHRYGGAAGVAVAALVVLVVFFVLFAFVLRARKGVALVLSAALAAVGGYAANRAASHVPDTVPGVWENQVRLDGFWVEAARAGKRSVALMAALAFDRPGADGARTLYGLGLPDLRGGSNGEWFLYTTDELVGARPPKGDTKASSSGTGTVFRVDFEDDVIDTKLYGPVNFVALEELRRRNAAIEEEVRDPDTDFRTSKELLEEQKKILSRLAYYGAPQDDDADQSYKGRVTVPLRVERTGSGAYSITIDGTTQEVSGDAWSDWYPVAFEFGPLVTGHAITRVRVVEEEPFELYVDSLHLDPENPPFWQPVSDPPGFGAQLAQLAGGRFETLGWGCMTNQLKDELLPVDVFLQDIEFTMAYRRRLTEAMLGRDGWDLLFSVFSTTDRVQHMMYRYYDPEHPLHDAEEAARVVSFFGEPTELADTIPAIYRQMDAIVGEVRSALGPDDLLLLCADHGFTSYRRGLEVNNWLAQEGFLVLRDDLVSRRDGRMLGAVDWSRTRAYSLGLGMVFLNLEGREPQGIVTKEEAPAVLAEIEAAFERLTEDGTPVGSDAQVLVDLYEGPEEWGTLEYPCADLMLGLAENYRVSWGSVSGDVRLVERDGEIQLGPTFRDNDKTWSGDHASNDPRLVSGIFFSSRPVDPPEGGFSVLHLAPTVLERLGATPPEHCDLPPLDLR